jgi:hypothetical protein
MSRLLDGFVMRMNRLYSSLALAGEAVLWMAVVGKGGGWTSWESHHVAVLRWLRISLALAGDADSLSAAACKGGIRMSTSPRRAAMRQGSMYVFHLHALRRRLCAASVAASA